MISGIVKRFAGPVVTGGLVLGAAVLAAPLLGGTSVPLSNGAPGLLVAVGLLLLLGYALKVLAWRRLFTVEERPHTLALVTANAGASILGVVLPGRLADLLRITIVRRTPNCPAGVRSLCLSLVMLGLIDSAALAPFALAAAAFPGHSVGMRPGLALVAGGGLAGAALIAVLPRLASNRRLLHHRAGRWLSPRTSSRGNAAAVAALLSGCWLVRIAAAMLFLGALGVGFSFPLAVLLLCAGKVAGALPGGQAGAGGAVLIASGVGGARAIDVAVSGQALSILCGVSMLLFAALWVIGLRLAAAAASPSRGLGRGSAPAGADLILAERLVLGP